MVVASVSFKQVELYGKQFIPVVSLNAATLSELRITTAEYKDDCRVADIGSYESVTITDVSNISITKLENLSATVDDGNNKVLTPVRYPQLSEDGVKYYYVSKADIGRLDFIAKQMYGAEAFWRYIARINGIMDPYTDMYVGQALKCPTVVAISNAMSDSVKQYA